MNNPFSRFFRKSGRQQPSSEAILAENMLHEECSIGGIKVTLDSTKTKKDRIEVRLSGGNSTEHGEILRMLLDRLSARYDLSSRLANDYTVLESAENVFQPGVPKNLPLRFEHVVETCGQLATEIDSKTSLADVLAGDQMLRASSHRQQEEARRAEKAHQIVPTIFAGVLEYCAKNHIPIDEQHHKGLMEAMLKSAEKVVDKVR